MSQEALPRTLERLFWDCDLPALSWREHRDFIIGRVLSRGRLEDLRWLLGKLGKKRLRDWIVAHQGRGLSVRQMCFWETILGLPHEQVSEWIRKALAEPWGAREKA